VWFLRHGSKDYWEDNNGWVWEAVVADQVRGYRVGDICTTLRHKSLRASPCQSEAPNARRTTIQTMTRVHKSGAHANNNVQECALGTLGQVSATVVEAFIVGRERMVRSLPRDP